MNSCETAALVMGRNNVALETVNMAFNIFVKLPCADKYSVKTVYSAD